MKVKKAVIVVRLVEESLERENAEIEKENNSRAHGRLASYSMV